MVLAVGAGAAACGGDAHCDARVHLSLTQAGTIAGAPGCPVSSAIKVDTTAFGRGRTVAAGVTAAVLAVASRTIDDGGNLDIELFSETRGAV